MMERYVNIGVSDQNVIFENIVNQIDSGRIQVEVSQVV